MVRNEISNILTELAERYETPQFIEGDPSWWMHQVSGERNQEATAFVASVLSYGSRTQFLPRIGLLLEYAGGDMDLWLRTGAYSEHFAIGDKQCFYRLYNNDTMRRFFDAYSAMLAQYGSMKAYVASCGGKALNAVEMICRWFAERGVNVVVPKDTTSACKRVCMFLRWMVRDGSPVDLGLWKDIIDKRTLIMPLDTHVVSEAMKLGLLQSRCASMSAALRLTDAMRDVFPDDPLKGDFALFGYGVDGL
jgi:uncharacterized protein (TIGR02757 family)